MQTPKSLEGRCVLVTGGAKRLGAAIGRKLHAAGANIVVHYNRSRPAAADLVAELDALRPGSALAVRADLLDVAQLPALVETALARYGRLDVLVNNAAVMTQHALFLEKTPEQCDTEIKVTLYGTINCCRAALPGMIDRTYGKIVNIATDAARIGQEREAVYAAAKGGVISFTKSIAKEVGKDNVNANVISPGATNSPMRNAILDKMRATMGAEKVAEREERVKRVYPLRRIGEMEDVSNAILFVASDSARHITGQVLSVNGGFAMV